MAAIINEMPIKKHLVKIALSIMLIVALIFFQLVHRQQVDLL